MIAKRGVKIVTGLLGENYEIHRDIRAQRNVLDRAPGSYKCDSCGERSAVLNPRALRHIKLGTRLRIQCRACILKERYPDLIYVPSERINWLCSALDTREFKFGRSRIHQWLKYPIAFVSPEHAAICVRACMGTKCRGCQREPIKLFLHHDHSTKEPVSALCNRCNLALGNAYSPDGESRDNTDTMRRLADIHDEGELRAR